MPHFRRLVTATAGVRNQVLSCGIWGGQSKVILGADFPGILPFPLPVHIPPTAL
jgi:hypothetical protein